jgi:hypothetical protein
MATVGGKKQQNDMKDHAPRSLLWLTHLYVASLPFFGFSFVNIGGRGLGRPDWIIGAVMIGLFAMNMGIRRVRLLKTKSNAFAALFAYSGMVGAINLFNAHNARLVDFGTKASQLILIVGIYLVISNLPLNEKEFLGITRTWTLVAVAVSVYGVYQLFAKTAGWPLASLPLTNPSISLTGMSGRVTFGFAQISSVFIEPSYLGSYLIGPILICAAIVLRGKGRAFLTHLPLVNQILFGSLCLAFLLTGSLGAFFSLFAILAIMIFKGGIAGDVARKLCLFILLLSAIGVLLLAMLDIGAGEFILTRIRSLFVGLVDPLNAPSVTSLANRSMRTIVGLRAWMTNPLIGTGMNSLGYYSELTDRANNPWSQLLADQGLFGLFSLALLFYVLLRSLTSRYRATHHDETQNLLLLALYFVLLSDLVDSLFTLTWVHPQRWFTLSLASVALRARRMSPDSQKSQSGA